MNNEMEDKWQCPDCMKINSVNMCSCGYVKVDFNSEQLENVEEIEKQPIWKNKKILIGVAIVLVAIVMIFVGKKIYDSNEKNKESDYLETIRFDTDLESGAVFDMTFSELKPIIGRELNVGELNSSSGGWQVLTKASKCTEYSILSSSGIWGINVIVDSKDRVAGVVIRTIITNSNKLSETELASFAKVLSIVCGATQESVANILRNDYYEYTGSGRFSRGVVLKVQPMDGCYSFEMSAATEKAFINGYGLGV